MTERGKLPALILAGLALRLMIAPLGGHPGDVATLARWAAAIHDHGLLNVYVTSDANYPPSGVALIGAAGWIYGWLAPGAEFPPEGALWLLAVKLPAILADGGIMLIIAHLARGRRGAGWLAASVAFNPALVYLSAWWGQLESVYALAALASVIAAMKGRPFRAGLWLGAGMMVKLQAAVVWPVVVLAAVSFPPDPRLRHRRRGHSEGAGGNEAIAGMLHAMPLLAAGTAIPLALALIPYAATGQAGLVARRLIALVEGPGWPTVNALNTWYLLTGGAGNWAYNVPLAHPDTAPLLAGIPARTAGAAALALWTAGVLWAGWRARREASGAAWLLTGALLALGVFLWPTQAHERYAFGAVVLLAGAVAVSLPLQRQAGDDMPGSGFTGPSGTKVVWQSAALYAMITGAHTLNLLWAAPFSPRLAWFAGGRIAGSLIALAMLGGALWGWAVLYRWERRNAP